MHACSVALSSEQSQLGDSRLAVPRRLVQPLQRAPATQRCPVPQPAAPAQLPPSPPGYPGHQLQLLFYGHWRPKVRPNRCPQHALAQLTWKDSLEGTSITGSYNHNKTLFVALMGPLQLVRPPPSDDKVIIQSVMPECPAHMLLPNAAKQCPCSVAFW